MKITRRTFIQASAASAAGALVPVGSSANQERRSFTPQPEGGDEGPEIIDTNVHLFEWPFRHLKYSRTGGLVEKLRSHRIGQAWAGSFEALFHKNLDQVNARLAEECQVKGDGMLLAFGSVNPVWPDWEEDLRRCDEVYRMPGIRLYPSYQGYELSDDRFARLVKEATKRSMVVQIVLEMEDERVHHPRVPIPTVDVAPLVGVLAGVPDARIQLLNSASAMRGRQAASLLAETMVAFDISHIEGTGGIGRLLEGNHWSLGIQLPVERLLFGSHAPFFPCESAVLKLFTSPLTLDQLQALMESNARALLRAGGRKVMP